LVICLYLPQRLRSLILKLGVKHIAAARGWDVVAFLLPKIGSSAKPFFSSPLFLQTTQQRHLFFEKQLGGL